LDFSSISVRSHARANRHHRLIVVRETPRTSAISLRLKPLFGRVDFQASSATYFFQSEWGGFLTSLNPSTGFLSWAKSFDTAVGSTVLVEDVDIDSIGNIYLAGSFRGTASGRPS